MAGPRTSYGGKLGSVWIRKKKRRSCDGFHDEQPTATTDSATTGADVSSLLINAGACGGELVQTKTAVDVATSGSDTERTNTTSSSSSSEDNADVSSTDGSDSSPDVAAPTSTRSTSRHRLVGWDEDLCRPIYEYESVNNPTSGSACSSDDDGEKICVGDDFDKEDDDALASTEDLSLALSLESSQESLFSSVGENITGTTSTSSTARPDSTRGSNRTRPRAARSYGGRKRGRAGLSAAAEAVLLDGEHAQTAGDGEQVSKRASKRTKRETTGAGGKRKVFGGRNISSRAGKTTASAAASPSMTETTLHSDDTTSITFEALAYRSMGFEDSMLTPQPYMYGNGNDGGKNVCNILDSDVQKSGAISGGGNGGDVAHVASDTTKKNGPILDLATSTKKKSSRRQYGGKRLQPRKSTTAAIDDDVSPTTSTNAKRDELDFSGDTSTVDGGTRLTQPSGKSSILAARAFFEHLDKTSTLSLENKDELLSPELRRHRRGADGTVAAACIRTSRRTADIDSDSKLAGEYEQYQQSSLSSDITPLPLGEYVKHRNEFFTSSTTICDGLLDDN